MRASAQLVSAARELFRATGRPAPGEKEGRVVPGEPLEATVEPPPRSRVAPDREIEDPPARTVLAGPFLILSPSARPAAREARRRGIARLLDRSELRAPHRAPHATRVPRVHPRAGWVEPV